MLNLFYQEPEFDRWIKFDRYPRRVVRRLLRGKPMPGGQMRVFLNLRKGLDSLGVRYRINDYRYAQRNPSAQVSILGKSFVLDAIDWKNPIVLGPAVHSHPSDDPTLLDRRKVSKIVVPGQWMVEMCRPFWGDLVTAWPVGIDTDLWKPHDGAKDIEVLIYDKIRWEHERYSAELLQPILRHLSSQGRSYRILRYGFYREEEFYELLQRSKSMVFICEHETQGIAYQQALASGVPIFAWDRGGAWQDPSYYPGKVFFEPVSSVPYWDRRCGSKFLDAVEFKSSWTPFWEEVSRKSFAPRDYVLENLTLEKSTREYLNLIE